MFDTELYQQVLGLSASWRVAEVKLDFDLTQIHNNGDHAVGSPRACPATRKDWPATIVQVAGCRAPSREPIARRGGRRSPQADEVPLDHFQGERTFAAASRTP